MRALLPMLLGLCALLVAGCDLIPVSYRYRLTVEIDTPQGLRSGSSVIEVTTSDGLGIPGPEAASAQNKVRGQAVIIHGLPGGPLFALLSRPGDADYAAMLAPRVIEPRLPGFDPSLSLRKRMLKLAHAQGVFEVPPRYDSRIITWPYLVRFRDIHDPKSVEAVEPDDLAASFGEGVKLHRITIQITDDPVTTGIEKRLGWLADIHGPLDGQKIMFPNADLSNQITSGDFRRGVN